MSAVILQAVQQAFYLKLTADSVLMDLVDGVYDAVPQQALMPYVVIGDGTSETVSQLGAELSECRMMFNVWTGGSGRKAALAILNRLHVMLHHGTLSFSGFSLHSMRVVRAETQVDVDQNQVYGMLELALTVRQN